MGLGGEKKLQESMTVNLFLLCAERVLDERSLYDVSMKEARVCVFPPCALFLSPGLLFINDRSDPYPVLF